MHMNIENSHKFRRDLKMIKQLLEGVRADFPPPARREIRLQDIPRFAYNIAMIYGKGKRILDIGGGTGLFSLGCAALSMESFLLDAGGWVDKPAWDSLLGLYQKYGITTIIGDATSIDLQF